MLFVHFINVPSTLYPSAFVYSYVFSEYSLNSLVSFFVYEKLPLLLPQGFFPLYVVVSALSFDMSATIIPSAVPSPSRSAYLRPDTLIFGAFFLNIVEPGNIAKLAIVIVCVLLLVPSLFVPVTFSVKLPSLFTS